MGNQRTKSALGQSRWSGDVRVASALPLKADIDRKVRHVSKVPVADSNLTLSAGELEAGLPLVRPRQHDLELSEKSGLRLDIYAAAVLLYDDVVAH